MASLKEATENVKARLRTPRGRNFLTFLAFLGISGILWFVLVINEEVQREMRCAVRIVNKPDSVTILSEVPDAINVSVSAKSSTILATKFMGKPTIDIDYTNFRSSNHIILGPTELRNIVRNKFGGNSQVLSVTPDSINLIYTTRPGVAMPVILDAKISVAPQFTLLNEMKLNLDSVMVYSLKPLPSSIRGIYTEPIRIENVDKAEAIATRLIAPPDTRVIPDVVETIIMVEPLISKTRKVLVRTKNVPGNVSMSTFPPMIEVNYMVPMSMYNTITPDFVVEADYNDTHRSHSPNIPVTISNIPNEFQNVYLSVDSVEFVIERH